MITIILADDHPVVRQGLAALLQSQADFQIVGQAGDGIETMDLVERLRPQALVLDLMMPGLNGLEVTRRVRQHSPGTRIVMLSMHADESYVLEALAAGATAYVLKKSTASDLVQAIHEAIAGRGFLSPPLADRFPEGYIHETSKESFDPYDTLTPREKEVLQMVAEGNTNAAIAARLSISPRTVEMHRASLMRKLGLDNQSDLIRFAFQRGIIEQL